MACFQPEVSLQLFEAVQQQDMPLDIIPYKMHDYQRLRKGRAAKAGPGALRGNKAARRGVQRNHLQRLTP